MCFHASLTRLKCFDLAGKISAAQGLCNAGVDAETKRKIDGLHEDHREQKIARSQTHLSVVGATEFAEILAKAGPPPKL